ncbi:15066_t:CDS:2, partial [Racocetra fulgida]
LLAKFSDFQTLELLTKNDREVKTIAASMKDKTITTVIENQIAIEDKIITTDLEDKTIKTSRQTKVDFEKFFAETDNFESENEDNYVIALIS